MNCPFCGAEQNKEVGFCTECGKYMGTAESDISVAIPEGDKKPDSKGEWATIGTWGWIGIILLLQIPILNLILTVIWSFGGARKNVKKTFARAFLILGLISTIVSVASLLYMLATGKIVGVSSVISKLL